MKTWSVVAIISASKYIGEFEAETAQEACDMAWEVASVNLCHQCADEAEDPEITEILAEEKK